MRHSRLMSKKEIICYILILTVFLVGYILYRWGDRF